MPKKDKNEDEEPKGEPLVINSEEEYDQLISEGFEVQGLYFSWSKEFEEKGVQAKIQLKKDGKLYLADANQIVDLAISLKQLYNFDLKKPVFTKTSRIGLTIDEEESLIDMVIGKYQKPLTVRRLETSNPERIYSLLQEWVSREKGIRFGLKNKRELFYLICIINEKERTIVRKNFHKELITLDDIKKIKNDAIKLDNSIALSFFYLSPKFHSDKKPDVLIGSILYDLKNRNTLFFNIQSGVSFQQDNYKLNSPVPKIADHLFQAGVDEKLICKSFIPLPIDSPWYTPLPWFSYSVLSDKEIAYTKTVPNSHKINIPEFFVFGATSPPDEKNSFNFNKFSSDSKGRASINLQFLNGEKALQYNFRFDRSMGEPLVHLDFAFFDSQENKLIEHFPIDLEKIYSFNSDLYVAIILAGLFDSYFTTIIKSGLKNLEHMIEQNPMLRFPFKWIWMIDTAIIWLNEHKEGYLLLEKLMRGETTLDDKEKELAQKINENRLDLIVEDENCDNFGVSHLGYMVFQRYKRGQTDVLMNP
jgi:hypothetical protein